MIILTCPTCGVQLAASYPADAHRALTVHNREQHTPTRKVLITLRGCDGWSTATFDATESEIALLTQIETLIGSRDGCNPGFALEFNPSWAVDFERQNSPSPEGDTPS